MSGTSLDGVDGVLVEFSTRHDGQVQLRTLASVSVDMPLGLQRKLRLLACGDYSGGASGASQASDPIEEAALAANALSDLYLKVIRDLKAQSPASSVEAIGAHGQTIRHRPELGFTLQLLNGARIAALSEIPTVCDFRSSDVALGGQGAPLVPLFHLDALASKDETRLILNLGGIANLSVLNAGTVVGFDTGPASTLLDAWAQTHLGKPFDQDGAWSASGTCDQGLLEHFMSEPYFALVAPKSTGRELFSAAWLEAKLSAFKAGRPLSPADVQATLSQLTARSVAEATQRAIHRAIQSKEHGKITLYACGGGVKNKHLMRDIAEAVQSKFGHTLKLRNTSELGIDAQQMEACAFAWLAWKRWNQQPLNYHPVTGSRRPHIAGALYLP
jgi:anhydro-N-acetylmuramic acid kinase